jgi:superfamily I DNA/RNA helicase/mRNA-degrading endonuclease RelE of RelBE toxin-antitoxin system
MAKWNLIAPPTFLNELLGLPADVSRRVTQKVKVIERDPISAQGDAKKIGDHTPPIYRTRIGNYRLFYSFGDGWVKLICIRKRDDRTYADDLPDRGSPATAPPANLIATELPEERTEAATFATAEPAILAEDDEADARLLTPEPAASPSAEPRLLPVVISTERLHQWQIPQNHWPILLQSTTEDDLLVADLPVALFDRICDILFPRSVAEIVRQPEYVLSTPADLDRYIEGELTAFLLRLDADQQRILETSLEGPALVKGGPGTGKSVLAIYRTARLVEAGRTPALFTTYTNALVGYSEQLLERLLGAPPVDRGVEVNTVDSVIMRRYTQAHGRPRFATDGQLEDALERALDSANIPAANVFDRKVRREVLRKLGRDYLHEELCDVIDARGIASCEAYVSMDRRGRGVPLRANVREAVWAVYETWTADLDHQGLTTWERMRRTALALAEADTVRPYQSLVIDEAQDLSPVALRFLLASVASPQGLYLTADASQSLYQRGFSWKAIHGDLNVRGRSVLLRRNYRNTAEITAACASILHGTGAGDDESVAQESAIHHGHAPTILFTRGGESEATAIRDFFVAAARELRLPIHAGAVLCHSKQLAQQIAGRLARMGTPAEFMDSREIDLRKPVVKVLTLHAAKGLEFPMVAIARLEAGSLPHHLSQLPEEEQAVVRDQQRRLFYVGCSRAMRALLVCATADNPSPFVEGLDAPLWQVSGFRF